MRRSGRCLASPREHPRVSCSRRGVSYAGCFLPCTRSIPMQHLHEEALARLADNDPAPEEALHLVECDLCRSRLTSFRADLAALRQLPAEPPPSAEWTRIISALGQR